MSPTERPPAKPIQLDFTITGLTITGVPGGVAHMKPWPLFARYCPEAHGAMTAKAPELEKGNLGDVLMDYPTNMERRR